MARTSRPRRSVRCCRTARRKRPASSRATGSSPLTASRSATSASSPVPSWSTARTSRPRWSSSAGASGSACGQDWRARREGPIRQRDPHPPDRRAAGRDGAAQGEPDRGAGRGLAANRRAHCDDVGRLVKLVTGQASVKELGGPLKMAQFSGEQAAMGPVALISFIALVSINLGSSTCCQSPCSTGVICSSTGSRPSSADGQPPRPGARLPFGPGAAAQPDAAGDDQRFGLIRPLAGFVRLDWLTRLGQGSGSARHIKPGFSRCGEGARF